MLVSPDATYHIKSHATVSDEFSKVRYGRTVITLIIPVLRRPWRVKPLLDSYYASRDSQTAKSEVLFVVSKDDDTEIVALDEAGAKYIVAGWSGGSKGDYARKINLGISMAPSNWYFTDADDLAFHSGWEHTMLTIAEETGKGVIGTNDLGNTAVMDGNHSTHSFLSDNYAWRGAIDDPPDEARISDPKPLHEGYWHNWVDTEFVGTARHRGEFAFAQHCRIEHLHFFWGKSGDDETYRHGRERYDEDLAHFRSRRHLWVGGGSGEY